MTDENMQLNATASQSEIAADNAAISFSASEPPKRSVYGWVVVATCLIGISTGPAAFCLASIGILAEPLATEFGWKRTAISLAISVMMLCTAMSLPIIGRFADRFGVKTILIPSILILALCFLAAPLMQSYWQFIAVYVAIGTIAVGTNSVPYMRILSAWFDRSRGLAIGIAGSGTGLGFAYVPMVTEALVSEFGWRGGYIGLGLIQLLVTLPLALLVLKETPEEMGLAPDGLKLKSHEQRPSIDDSHGDSLKQALRRRDFWSLTLIFMSLAFVLYGLIPHLVPMLTDRGITPAKAAQLASLFGASAFAGRLLIGFLIDKYDARFIAFVFFSLSAVGLGIFVLSLPYWVLVVAAVLLGGSLGAEVDMLAYLTSRYFGLKCFAEIFGVLFSAVMLAMSLGPLVFGIVFDSTGSYQAVMLLGIPICIVAVLLLLLLRPYGERKRGAPISST